MGNKAMPIRHEVGRKVAGDAYCRSVAVRAPGSDSLREIICCSMMGAVDVLDVILRVVTVLCDYTENSPAGKMQTAGMRSK
jgi:hypothetical protein